MSRIKGGETPPLMAQRLMSPSPDPRIYCLLQSTSAHPGLPEGIAPAGLLSAEELARCTGFKVLKRRRDWLLGRWTAKHLLQAYLAITWGRSAPLDQIEILVDEDGAPYARLGTRLPLSLSISHSGLESFCAVCELNVGHVGADIEQVEPRELSFVRTFFTEHENAAVEAVSLEERDRMITALWTAKEAALKALRLGLRADTRQLSVGISSLSSNWNSIGIYLDPLLLPPASSQIAAWSQVQGSSVLSLALLAPS